MSSVPAVCRQAPDFSVGQPPAVGEGGGVPVHYDKGTSSSRGRVSSLAGLHFDLTLRVDHRLIINLPALQDSWVLVAPEDGHCSICMLGLSRRTTVRLRGCKHPFHRKCIFSWFVTNASCPICRDKVLTHLIFDLSDLVKFW
ncbi:hypothetical protein QYE76_007907 [Lolium multiflorum]|uniref:RING-type domain-containing protein n=1 Tax=Lolium multiflorum TaxID=4521 RepID=A0AAD8UTR1_LOLMU|nr:hypothetical protein QYE76_007907 [Lolium multiflorum]